MSFAMNRTLPPVAQNILLTSAAGLAYVLIYRINELLDVWAIYTQGINLIYLPAGIKHLAILLAGKWGALGCMTALFFLAGEFWQGVPIEQLGLYSLVSTGSTWAGIVLSLRIMGIDKDLGNFRFFHLPVMDIITTALHGFTANAFFIASGMKTEHFISNALAMMFGDFVGSFIILMLLWLALFTMRNSRATSTQ
jgi:hypothetical protein